MVMYKKSIPYIILSFLFISFLPLNAWECCEPLDIAIEARVAYYHPSSNRVRRIYNNGWADYQLEISKGIFRDWRIWTGVSGFSEKGRSIGFKDHTRLQLIPVYLGIKYFFPLCNGFKIYAGGAACYSFLRIKDDSDYVHRHTHKNDWGGLIQSGVTYNFWNCAYISAFADYFFQEFKFHDSYRSSYSCYHSGYIERNKLDMSGYKIGVGIGMTF